MSEINGELRKSWYPWLELQGHMFCLWSVSYHFTLSFSIALARSPLNKDFRDHAEQQHIAAQQKAALQVS